MKADTRDVIAINTILTDNGVMGMKYPRFIVQNRFGGHEPLPESIAIRAAAEPSKIFSPQSTKRLLGS